MTSNLINFVVDNFLSKFIEIDKSQTYASLWSGVLELKNVKIKKECFNSINLPYFVLEKGFIGKIKIELKLPFFYNNPINIYINDIFILSKQKDINHLNESEEIQSMKDFKNKKLISDEVIFNKLEEIESQEPSFATQIIKNINININNINIINKINVINNTNYINNSYQINFDNISKDFGINNDQVTNSLKYFDLSPSSNESEEDYDNISIISHTGLNDLILLKKIMYIKDIIGN